MRSRTQDELVHDYYLNKRSEGIKTKIEMLEKNHNDFKRFYPSAEGLKDLPGFSSHLHRIHPQKPYTSRGKMNSMKTP